MIPIQLLYGIIPLLMIFVLIRMKIKSARKRKEFDQLFVSKQH